MNTEQLILKKVKHAQINKQLMFDVASLNEHFDGLLIHATDVLVVEEGEFVKEYIKHSDVNFDSATANEVSDGGMTYEEAEKEMCRGMFVALPTWKGFWFKEINDGETLVFTKDG